jgi:crotonobetainyl-CoA:carnitine CoA-transferase CaiB-like acyl-CoA transferase
VIAGPLEGITVLDLTRLQPGNYATTLMADLGADVIKVEEPGRGDYVRWTPPMIGAVSAAHLILNRNKKSVTLNLKTEDGVILLQRLVEKADVLIESFRPGVMDRLGVGYEVLCRSKPDLVYAAITGYGQDGPYRSRAGHDINYIGISGVLGATGPAGGDPVLPSVQVADLSGAMMAVIGVLSAIVRRNDTGNGDFVDVSMMDASLSWLALHLAPWFAGGETLKRGEGLLNGGYPFYRTYRCKDDKHVSVGALEPQFWEALCRGLDLDELVSDQYSSGERRIEIHGIFEAKFMERPRDEWVRILSGLDACVAPVNDFDEMSRDLQVLARKMISEKDMKGVGAFKELGVPVRLTNSPGSVRMAAPGLGEHNEEVYSSLGIEKTVLDRFATDGVI